MKTELEIAAIRRDLAYLQKRLDALTPKFKQGDTVILRGTITHCHGGHRMYEVLVEGTGNVLTIAEKALRETSSR